MDTFIKIKDLYVNAGEIASFRFKEINSASGKWFTIRFFLKNGRDMESKQMTVEEKERIEKLMKRNIVVYDWLLTACKKAETPPKLHEIGAKAGAGAA